MYELVKNNNVAIFGVNGFIGKNLCKKFIEKNYNVKGFARKNFYLKSLKFVKTEITSDINWSNLLNNIHTIIYCVGSAHNKYRFNKKTEKQNINALKNLINQANSLGVKRFVYLSSIGVNGKSFLKPITEASNVNPNDNYSKNKRKIELEIYNLSKKYKIDFVIVRPPMVYGKNAPGNFKTLTNLVKFGMPLPFANINNERSFIAIDNLTEFLILVSTTPKLNKSNFEIFLISDNETISTSKLIKILSEKINKKLILFTIPEILIKFLLIILLKSKLIPSLLNSLVIDNTKAKNLGWKPVTNLYDQLNKF